MSVLSDLKAAFRQAIKVVSGGPNNRTRGLGLIGVLDSFLDSVLLLEDLPATLVTNKVRGTHKQVISLADRNALQSRQVLMAGTECYVIAENKTYVVSRNDALLTGQGFLAFVDGESAVTCRAEWGQTMAADAQARAAVRRYRAITADWALDELMKIQLGAQDEFFSARAAGGPFPAPTQAGQTTPDWFPAAAPVPPTALSQALSLAYARYYLTNPAGGIVAGRLYPITDAWNGGAATQVVYLEGLSNMSFAPIGYLNGAQVSVNVAAGTTAPVGGGSAPISKTYAELKVLVDAGTLVPGQEYVVNDYQTIHQIVSSQDICENGVILPGVLATYTGGDPATNGCDPLLLKAATTNTFSTEAKSLLYPEDEIDYYFNHDFFGAYANTYSGILDPALRKGDIGRRRYPNKQLETQYDFRFWRLRRYKVTGRKTDLNNDLGFYDNSHFGGSVVYDPTLCSILGMLNPGNAPLLFQFPATNDRPVAVFYGVNNEAHDFEIVMNDGRVFTQINNAPAGTFQPEMTFLGVTVGSLAAGYTKYLLYEVTNHYADFIGKHLCSTTNGNPQSGAIFNFDPLDYKDYYTFTGSYQNGANNTIAADQSYNQYYSVEITGGYNDIPDVVFAGGADSVRLSSEAYDCTFFAYLYQVDLVDSANLTAVNRFSQVNITGCYSSDFNGLNGLKATGSVTNCFFSDRQYLYNVQSLNVGNITNGYFFDSHDIVSEDITYSFFVEVTTKATLKRVNLSGIWLANGVNLTSDVNLNLANIISRAYALPQQTHIVGFVPGSYPSAPTYFYEVIAADGTPTRKSIDGLITYSPGGSAGNNGTNLAHLDATQTFTGNNTFSQTIGLIDPSGQFPSQVGFLNNQQLDFHDNDQGLQASSEMYLQASGLQMNVPDGTFGGQKRIAISQEQIAFGNQGGLLRSRAGFVGIFLDSASKTLSFQAEHLTAQPGIGPNDLVVMSQLAGANIAEVAGHNSFVSYATYGALDTAISGQSAPTDSTGPNGTTQFVDGLYTVVKLLDAFAESILTLRPNICYQFGNGTGFANLITDLGLAVQCKITGVPFAPSRPMRVQLSGLSDVIYEGAIHEASGGASAVAMSGSAKLRHTGMVRGGYSDAGAILLQDTARYLLHGTVYSSGKSVATLSGNSYAELHLTEPAVGFFAPGFVLADNAELILSGGYHAGIEGQDRGILRMSGNAKATLQDGVYYGVNNTPIVMSGTCELRIDSGVNFKANQSSATPYLISGPATCKVYVAAGAKLAGAIDPALTIINVPANGPVAAPFVFAPNGTRYQVGVSNTGQPVFTLAP